MIYSINKKIILEDLDGVMDYLNDDKEMDHVNNSGVTGKVNPTKDPIWGSSVNQVDKIKDLGDKINPKVYERTTNPDNMRTPWQQHTMFNLYKR